MGHGETGELHQDLLETKRFFRMKKGVWKRLGLGLKRMDMRIVVISPIEVGNMGIEATENLHTNTSKYGQRHRSQAKVDFRLLQIAR